MILILTAPVRQLGCESFTRNNSQPFKPTPTVTNGTVWDRRKGTRKGDPSTSFLLLTGARRVGSFLGSPTTEPFFSRIGLKGQGGVMVTALELDTWGHPSHLRHSQSCSPGPSPSCVCPSTFPTCWAWYQRERKPRLQRA